MTGRVIRKGDTIIINLRDLNRVDDVAALRAEVLAVSRTRPRRVRALMGRLRLWLSRSRRAERAERAVRVRMDQ